MKKLFIILSFLIISLSAESSNSKECYTCYADSVLHVLSIREYDFCFAKYDDKKLLLSNPIEESWGAKKNKYRMKNYRVSLVNRSPGLLHSKDRKFYRDKYSGAEKYEDDYPLLFFESEDGTSFYHVFGYGDFPSVNLDISNCECYLNSRIKKKEDRFNKISSYYFTYNIGAYTTKPDAIVVLKSDSIYAIGIALSGKSQCSNTEGIYLLFDDDEVYKDTQVICDYTIMDNFYVLQATLYLTPDQFKRLTEHTIKAVKLGCLEADISSTLLKNLCRTLMNKE